MPQEKNLEILNLVIGIASIVISTVLAFILNPQKITPQTWIILGVIILVSFVVFITGYIVSRWKTMEEIIGSNTKEINKMKEAFNIYRRLDKIELYLESLRKNKKGQFAIDPRIIGWILLVILFILLLRSINLS